ncbi:MAG: tripartite ATP-independent periplasmic transporter DctQ [Hyphomicrobiales bacterium]|nr:tripartite ATP-independent periplasmic transporter DctQ [Hyphomicrobiales bacterium]
MTPASVMSGERVAISGWRETLVRLGDRVSTICTFIAAVSLAVIVCVNGANVLGRYFFSAPISWAEELMLYLMVLTVFAGAATVTWRQEHIKIDAFLLRLPPSARRVAVLATGVVTVLAIGAAVYASFLVVSMLYGFDQHSDALEAPMWIPQSVVTIGLSLNAILFLMRSLGATPAPTSENAGLHGGGR